MINKWLNEKERSTKTPNFFIIDLTENDFNSDELKEFIAKKILIHLTKPHKLERIFKDRPAEELKNYILNLKIPEKGVDFSPRQSFWAEIVAAEILKDIKNHVLPIYRLRYKELKNRAMRGRADVVTCDFIDDKPKIIFSEIKSKTAYISPKQSEELAEEAFDGLSLNNVEIPEIIEHISDILEDLPDETPNKYRLMDLFDNALLFPASYSKDFHIFFVFEQRRWKEECLKVFTDEKLKKVSNLTINIVLIDSLGDLIEDTYLLVPQAAEDVVYGE